jgi:hypothetical protein
MLVDSAARLAVRAAAARVSGDRAGALRALDEIFAAGRLPRAPLEGRYRGELITPSLHPVLDALGRALTGWWLPWQGKTFSAAAQTGDNIFSSDGRLLARLVWPFYRGDVPDGPGRVRALRFRTYSGSSALDPAQNVLKIDYDWEVNPRLIVRAVLDELVQVEADYYLGKALLRRRPGRYVCAAYFALSPG